MRQFPQFLTALLECVRHILLKKKTENDVLVLSRLDGSTKPLGGLPEAFLEFPVIAINTHIILTGGWGLQILLTAPLQSGTIENRELLPEMLNRRLSVLTICTRGSQ